MFNKPNLSIPLASSYNERGVSGFAATVTNGLDQRKINSIYEPIRNSITGKTTLYLCKRPGFADSGNTYGTSGQVGYLTVIRPGGTSFSASDVWVFSTSGNDIRASSSSTTTTIATAAGYVPFCVDKTAISGTETLIFQMRNASLTQRIWYSSAIATFTEITDSDLTGLVVLGKMEPMDGYAFIMDTSNRIHNSDLNSLANWTAGNYITKQIQQDFARGLMRLDKQILAFGGETVEVFRNAGNPTGSPLESIPSLAARVGMQAIDAAGVTNYYAIVEKKLYFVGRNKGLFMCAFDGQTFHTVSTPAIDKILATMPQIYSVNTVMISGQIGVAVGFDATTATTQRWLMYFPKWNEWFEWNSTVFTPVGLSNFKVGVGSNQHKIYQFANSDTWQDDGTNYTWTHQFQLPSNGNERQFMPYMALKGDTARSAQNISVEFSDDDYQNFSTARPIDMTSKQKMLTRCGSWQGSRVVRLSHTGNTEVRLSEFLARIE